MTDYQPGAPIWARFVDSGNATQKKDPYLSWRLPAGQEKLPPPPGAMEDCPLPFDWDMRRYAAFDVETTGLDAFRDRIVEIGLILFHFDSEGALVPESEWSTLVHPCIPIPATATVIHGINDVDVFNSPRFADLAYELVDKLQGRVLVAHNASFDVGFLKSEYSRLKSTLSEMEIADTLGLLRLAVPNLLSYNLGKAAYVLGLTTGTAHRALDDAKTCMQIFSHCARILTGRCP